MNREFITYLNKHGTERVSNTHLIFINELMKNKNIGEWGMLYKLSNLIYKNVKAKEQKTLNEVVETFNNKSK